VGAYILRRLLGLLPVLVAAVLLTFAANRFVPGDPITIMLGDQGGNVQLEQKLRAEYGLDRPVTVQFVDYVSKLARGDFGLSFRYPGVPVTQVIKDALWISPLLAAAALALAVPIGISLGIVAALRRNTAVDRAVMGFAVFGFSTPHFFLGILMILLFAMQLRWLPSSGSETWQHMVMPVLTLGTAAAGTLARFTRTAMLEVMGQPFLRTAHGKGATAAYALRRHALPNAAIPVVTVVGFQIGGLIGGALVTETVFAWPGVGRLLVSAVSGRDLAVVQTIVLLVAATMVTANYLVDLAYGLLDPRIRDQRQ
jgi:peptide/nickel transport system permease protein